MIISALSVFCKVLVVLIRIIKGFDRFVPGISCDSSVLELRKNLYELWNFYHVFRLRQGVDLSMPS